MAGCQTIPKARSMSREMALISKARGMSREMAFVQNFSFLVQRMAEISPGQTNKKTNNQENKQTIGVKTEDSLPSAPSDDVMHRLDMALGRSGVQKLGNIVLLLLVAMV